MPKRRTRTPLEMTIETLKCAALRLKLNFPSIEIAKEQALEELIEARAALTDIIDELDRP